jgi:hypothetical protein
MIQRDGRLGLDKGTDVVLEAMRLTRDHPGLTAQEWFNHLFFADALGRPGLRQPGELRALLQQALQGRNLDFQGNPPASFSLSNKTTQQEITSTSWGSSYAPVPVHIPRNAIAHYALEVKLKSSPSFAFHYPVQVRLNYHGTAIDWLGNDNGSSLWTLNHEAEVVTIPIQIGGTCMKVNREDGSCVDSVSVEIMNSSNESPLAASKKPIGRKRFYLRLFQ